MRFQVLSRYYKWSGYAQDYKDLERVFNVLHSKVATLYKKWTSSITGDKAFCYFPANLGGIFGLCLGGSIVSIMEIIWFLIDLLCTIIHEVFKRKNVTPNNGKYGNKVFVINQSVPKEPNKVLKNDINTKKLEKSSSKARFKFINWTITRSNHNNNFIRVLTCSECFWRVIY